jgi:hypothetical protein
MISFTSVILGHLLGDYLLQNVWMATTKSKKGMQGWLAATVHCVIYSAAVSLLCWHASPLFFGLVFLSHFPVDH